jgi:uncharacterized protein YqfA (UPF0365 family)
MGRKTQIAVVTGVLVLVLGAIAAYAYDSSQKDKIADGVTIGGVDVGGMDSAEAKRAVRHQLLAPLRHSLRVGFEGKTWKLEGKSLKVSANVDNAVEEALADSREGGLPGRLARYVTGGSVDKQVSADIAYSQPAVRSRAPSTAKRRTPTSTQRRTRSKSSPARTGASCAIGCSPAS